MYILVLRNRKILGASGASDASDANCACELCVRGVTGSTGEGGNLGDDRYLGIIDEISTSPGL